MMMWLIVIALALTAATILVFALIHEDRAARREQAPCSLVCSCGGEWDKWKGVDTDYASKPAERYQMRYCSQCGRADRRIVK